MNDKIILQTICKNFNKTKIKLTQHLNTEYNFGHYYWYIEDEAGNILDTGRSTGAPSDKVDKSILTDILTRYKE